MFNCRQTTALMEADMESVSRAERAAFAAHMYSCPGCRAHAARLNAAEGGGTPEERAVAARLWAGDLRDPEFVQVVYQDRVAAPADPLPGVPPCRIS